MFSFSKQYITLNADVARDNFILISVSQDPSFENVTPR